MRTHDLRMHDIVSAMDAMHDIVSAMDVMHDILSAMDAMHDIVSAMDAMHDKVSAMDAMHDTVSAMDVMHDIVSAMDAMHDKVSAMDAMHDTVSAMDVMHDIVSAMDAMHDRAVGRCMVLATTTTSVGGGGEKAAATTTSRDGGGGDKGAAISTTAPTPLAPNPASILPPIECGGESEDLLQLNRTNIVTFARTDRSKIDNFSQFREFPTFAPKTSIALCDGVSRPPRLTTFFALYRRMPCALMLPASIKSRTLYSSRLSDSTLTNSPSARLRRKELLSQHVHAYELHSAASVLRAQYSPQSLHFLGVSVWSHTWSLPH